MDECGKRDSQIGPADSLIRQALDQIEDALYISNLQTDELNYLNVRIETITGFSVQELQEMGVQGVRERIHPDDRERYLAGLHRLVEQGGSELLEYRWLHKDGTYRWLRTSRRVMRDAQENPTTLVGTLRDITEQRKAAETLWEAEAFNTAILDTTGALIVVLDPQGRIVRFNRACEETTGYSAEEVIGRVIWEFLIPPEKVKEVRETFVQLHDQALPSRHEGDWLTREGERRRISWSNTTSRDEQGNLRYIVTSGMDITEQRAAEQELRESEERFRALYEQAAVGLKLVGLDGRIRAANQKMADILGYTQQELVGREMDDFIAPEDLPAERRLRAQLMAGEISSYTMEKRYLRQGVQPIWVRATTSLARGMREPYRICIVEDITEQKRIEQERQELVEELQLSAEELEAQNEELNEAQAGINAERHRYQELFEFAPDGYLVTTPDGVIQEANQAMADLLRVPADSLVGHSLAEYILGDQQASLNAIFPRLHEGQSVRDWQVQLKPRDGEAFPASITVTSVTDAGERTRGLRWLIRDITDRVEAEQALRESEERFRRLVEPWAQATWELNAEGKLVTDSPSWRHYTGQSFEEAKGLGWVNAVHPDDRAYAEQQWREAVATGANVNVEFRLRSADGGWRWTNVRVVPLRNPDGSVRKWVGMNLDITERKQAEQALRRSEDLFRSLLENSREGIHRLNLLTGEYDFISPSMERLSGYTLQELTAMSMDEIMEHMHPEDREPFLRYLQEVMDHPGVIRPPIEYRIRNKSGEYRWFSDNRTAITDAEGRVVALVATSRDITEQKQAEEALRLSNAKLSLLADSATRLVGLTSEENGYQFIADRLCDLADAIVVNISTYDEESNLLTAQAFSSTESIQQAVTHLVDYPLVPAQYPLSLEASQNLKRQQLVRIPGIYELALGRISPQVAKELEQALGVGEIWGIGLAQDDQLLGSATFILPAGQHLALPHIIETFAYQVTIWLRRQQVEQALRESEERFREVFTHTRDALYRLDVTNDRYDYANPAMEELIGLSSQEMARQGVRAYLERLHPEDRERLAEYLDAVRNRKLDEGILERTNRIEYRWRVRSGEYHWFNDRRTLVTKPDGTQAIVGSMSDITEIKQSEQRLRELNETLEQRVAERTVQLRTLTAELSRAEERERQRLARILHDHLQQLLVAARLNISTMQRRLTDDPLQRAAQRVDEVLDEAIRTSRSLTAELSPPVLYDAGLTPALHWLARWIQEKHGLVVEVDAEDLGNQPPEGLRAMLFQATRELLFNVVKHAGVDRAKLTLRRVSEDQVELTVQDEGVGFDPARIGQQPEGGFGLLSIRERLELLGGQMDVVSAVGKGTQVTLRVPLRGAEIEAAEESAKQAAQRLAEAERGRAEPQVVEGEAAAMPSVRVLLVDDHVIMRQGLARMLQDEPGIELAGQADNGREAIALALMSHPDVVLMDVSMPGMDGVEATRRILDRMPDVKVIGLSMHEGSEMAARMRQAGAVDYIPKGGDPSALIEAVRQWARKKQSSPVPTKGD